MKIRYKIPAVVLGMTVNGLGVVRSLARNGIKAYALDSNRERPAMSTRYAECLVCPDAQEDSDSFKDFLIDLTKKIGGMAVLLPTGDAYNEFVNNNRHELNPYLKFAMPSKEVMDQLLNKKGQYIVAKRLCIPIPETHFPQSLEEVQSIAKNLKYPVILKGLSTGNWRKRFGDKKAVIAKDRQELIATYAGLCEVDHIQPIIQEIIQGEDTNHYKICAYMDRDSRPLLIFTLQKIRQYPCDFGIGSSVISTWQPEVIELGLRFMRNIGYWGVGSIEFKKDECDGKFKMIEINPRLWAQNSLPDVCGQNFSLTAYLDIIGEKIEPKTSFQEGIKWIAFNEDRTSFKGYHSQGRMRWPHWLKSVLTGKRVWATWTCDDPMPFFKAVRFGFLPFEKIFMKIKSRFSSRSLHVRGTSDEVSLEIIRDFDSFLKLRQGWNSLLEKSGINNPFLRHEWLSSWWKGYGSDKKLFVVCFKKGGEVIGFAPLMKYRTKLTGISTEAIGFIANHWVGLDFIFLRDKNRIDCLAKLQECLLKEKKITILSYLKEDCKTLELLTNELKTRKAKFKITPKESSYINIKGTWGEYLRGKTYNFRKDDKKKRKMIEDRGRVEFVRLTSDFDIKTIIDELKEVSVNSWQGKNGKAIISSEQGDIFYEDLFKEWRDYEIADISLLRLNGKAIAYIVGFNFNGCFYVFDTAYDERFKKMSPGMVIHNMLLEQLFSQGPKKFDFGYMADYKKRWTDSVSVISDLIVFPKSISGMMLYFADELKDKMRKKGDYKV